MEKLWVDKHRPQTLSQLTYHPELSQLFKQLAIQSDFPHLIIYGPDGSGKKTRAMCFLEQFYGMGVYKLKSTTILFKPQNSTTEVEYNLLESNHHVDVTPSNAERNDRHVINNVIKDVSTTNVEKKTRKLKVIIVNEADKLSREAQASLRRTMEKYSQNCRLILICEGVHKLIAPIRSRCLSIRVKSPSSEQIYDIMKHIANQENLSNLKQGSINQIAVDCDGNLRKALLSLQLAATFPESKRPVLQDWKQQVRRAGNVILTNQTQEVYKILQDIFYKLLINCIEQGLILKELVNELLKSKLSDKILIEIIYRAVETEKNMCQGDKMIYHLLAFGAKCVALVQQAR